MGLKMIKKYTLEELISLSQGDYPWWNTGETHDERMFYTAVYHQMMADMCLVNAYQPDYAGGVVDKFVFEYYDSAHDLIFWKTQTTHLNLSDLSLESK